MALALLLMRVLLFPVPLLLCGVQHLPARCRAAQLPGGVPGPGLPAQHVAATLEGPMQSHTNLGGQQADTQVCCCAKARSAASAETYRVECRSVNVAPCVLFR